MNLPKPLCYVWSVWIFMWMLLTTGVIVSLVVIVGVLGLSQDRIQALLRFWAHILAGGACCRLSSSGMEKLEPGASFIFASNHASALDIPALLATLPTNFRWIAKKELFNIPIFGRSLRAAGYIAIDRSNRRSAMQSIIAAAERIKNGTSVIIFPEGTRSQDGKLLPFKAGGLFMLARYSGRPVVPVAIVGSYDVMPTKNLLINPGPIQVKIGNPLAPEETADLDRNQLANLIRQKVLALLNQNQDQPLSPAA